MSSCEALTLEASRILASPPFQSSPQLCRFLEYVVGRASQGKGAELKESTIGIDVFGRPAASYDPRVDPVVRVMAVRLRRKIDEYYRSATCAGPRLAIPKGSYVPELVTTAQAEAQAEAEPSLAVLPFHPLASAPEHEHFADGMAEAILTRLAKIPGLRVISRTSTLRFRGQAPPLAEVASVLGVNHVLEGSILWAGERVRINAQLIAVPLERHLWAESYDRSLRDALSLQEDVARAIARGIGDRLSRAPEGEAAPAASAVRQASPAAWVEYARGLSHLARGVAGANEATARFRNALRLDPDFGQAHASLAETFLLLESFGGRADLHVQARSLARRALVLDPSLAEAHGAMGGVLSLEWDWDQALAVLELALRMNPNSALSRRRYAYCLMALGRAGEARLQAEKLLEIDPLSPFSPDLAVLAAYFDADYEDAAERSAHVVDQYPRFAPGYIHRLMALMALRDWERAHCVFRDMMQIAEHRPEDAIHEVAVLAGMGQRNRAVDVFDSVVRAFSGPGSGLSHMSLASAHLALGDRHRALDELELSFDQREWRFQYIRTAVLNSLADEPRYQNLLRMAGLPPV